MKKVLSVIIPVIVILVSALLVLNFTVLKEKSGIKEAQIIPVSSKVNSENKGKHLCCSEDEEGAVSDNSIYQLNSQWTNQEGQTVSLKSFMGKPVVLTMFYASCTYACPLLVNDMQRVESSLSANNRNNYRFILVSIDPERDTPEKLKIYAKEHGLDLSTWTLLTGKSDDIMELAAMTGFKYKKDDKGNYSHSNLITLLNEKGEIAHHQTGLNQDIARTVNQLKNL
jgi:protein SCO1/2